MKNKTFYIILTGLVVVGAVLGILQFTSNQASAYLSEDEAKQKATSQFSGDIKEIELEEENNRKVYEIDIEGTDRHYDLTIDAETGEILELDEKMTNNQSTAAKDDQSQDDSADGTAQDDTNNQPSDDAAQSNKQALISSDEARSIALEEYDGDIIEFELDEDDGQTYYEIEIRTTNNEKVELEIDAYTGDMISISRKNDDD
ncbi:PepSY domain-containing protein [Gracilibacillus caseinilyticus]|uniref:PepSY domain-containing protein n=1 Tax=Gracilibacillus caseinilyticus TaxID=2932256 RepID=A0ABY4EQG7_9BACI|nr:PepSY domain-containing protein [Gracilibacillus caseinilyticus]UOQ46688.1 PepSY domain-containing protein [Gracilibacillus caseinilyticus]